MQEKPDEADKTPPITVDDQTIVIAVNHPVTISVRPPTIGQVIRRLRDFRRWKGWKRGRYADEAGLHWSVTRFIDRPDWNPETDTVRALEAIIPHDFNAFRPLETLEEDDADHD